MDDGPFATTRARRPATTRWVAPTAVSTKRRVPFTVPSSRHTIAPASAFGSNAPKLQQTREAPACSASSSSPAAVAAAASMGVASPPVLPADPPAATSLSARFASTAPSNGAGQAARPASSIAIAISRRPPSVGSQPRLATPCSTSADHTVATASGRFARVIASAAGQCSSRKPRSESRSIDRSSAPGSDAGASARRSIMRAPSRTRPARATPRARPPRRRAGRAAPPRYARRARQRTGGPRSASPTSGTARSRP